MKEFTNVPKNVILAALLPATPDKLFNMYLDAESHAAITGASVIIEPHKQEKL